MSDTTCFVADCGYPVRTRGLCNAHSVRYIRTGVLGGPVKRRGPRRAHSCTTEGCDAPHYCGGHCTKHYQRMNKTGSTRSQMRSQGADHHCWRGDEISYRTAHERVWNAYGPAASHSCVDCGGGAEHWSYDHGDPDEKVSPTGQPYSVKVEHYEPRCVRCHVRFDHKVAA